MLPTEKAKEIADGVSGESEVLVFEDSGHFAPLEEKESFIRIVLNFLGVN